MTGAHWSVLLVYLAFTLAATLLALARRRLRPGAGGESVWRKYPGYILINLVFLATSWLPAGWHALTLLLALLGGLAAYEMARGVLTPAVFASARGARNLASVLPVVTTVLVAVADWLEPASWLRAWLAVLLVFVVINTLIAEPAYYGSRALAVAGCLVYLPICLAAYVWLRQADASGFQAAFLYLVVATNDALAQVTGQLLGKRPLAPRLSPAKTVEGALGGLLFAAGMGAALAGTLGWNAPTGGLLGLLIGLAGLAGDLTASAWKRALGLKNFSSLLGPQGGVLDRFDALILAAPVYYLLMTWSAH